MRLKISPQSNIVFLYNVKLQYTTPLEKRIATNSSRLKMVRAKNPMNSKTNWSINLIYHPIIFTNFRNRVSKNFIDQKVASDSLLKWKNKIIVC